MQPYKDETIIMQKLAENPTDHEDEYAPMEQTEASSLETITPVAKEISEEMDLSERAPDFGDSCLLGIRSP